MQVKMQNDHVLEIAEGMTVYEAAREAGLITREVMVPRSAE